MPLRLYPPLLAALMVALAAAVPGTFWWHARSVRAGHALRMRAPAVAHPSPDADNPTAVAPVRPRPSVAVVAPFRAARIAQRTLHSPDTGPDAASVTLAPSGTTARRRRHRR